MFQELIANAAVNGLLNMIGIPGIVGLAAAGLVSWKVMAGANKAILLLVLLAIGGAGAWWFWLRGGTVGIPGKTFLSGLLNPEKPEPTPPAPAPVPEPAKEPPHLPPYEAMRDYWRGKARHAATLPMQPLPKYPPVTKGKYPPVTKGAPPPLTWPQQHAAALGKLEANRWVNITRSPESYRDYHDPAARGQRHRERLAKNDERKRKEELPASAEGQRGFASIAPSPPPPVVMTPGLARAQALDMQERRIDQAQALLARVMERQARTESQELAGRGAQGW